MGLKRQFKKVKRIFNPTSGIEDRGAGGTGFLREVTETGFLKSDVSKFQEAGQRLATIDNTILAPSKKTETFRTNQSSLADAQTASFKAKFTSGEGIEDMANVFAQRLSNIRKKRRAPGLLQTRGER